MTQVAKPRPSMSIIFGSIVVLSVQLLRGITSRTDSCQCQWVAFHPTETGATQNVNYGVVFPVSLSDDVVLNASPSYIDLDAFIRFSRLAIGNSTKVNDLGFLKTMVAFQNRYMVMEVLFDRNRDLDKDVEDPVVVSKYNIESAIKDSIRLNFGECGLASSLRSLQVKYVNKLTKVCIVKAAREEYQKVWCSITLVKSIGNYPAVFNLLDASGSIRACKNAALKCETVKFEHYKLLAGARCTPQNNLDMQKCLEIIKTLES